MTTININNINDAKAFIEEHKEQNKKVLTMYREIRNDIEEEKRN